MLRRTLFIGLMIISLGLTLNIDFYYSSTCPHCHKVLDSGILDNVSKEYNATLHKYCVDNSKTYDKLIKIQKYYRDVRGINNVIGGVPTVIVYNKDWKNGIMIQGDDPIIQNLKTVVLQCLQKNKTNQKCNDTLSNNITYNITNTEHVTLLNKYKEIKSNDYIGKLGLTIVLSAADSINPCIMAILTLLLATLAKSDPRKAVKHAILFILIVYISYFIIGLLLFYGLEEIINKFATGWANYVLWISCIVLIIVGLINIKEFLFFGKGISLKLPDKYAKKTKELIEEGTAVSIAILAAMVTLVEFPCSGMMYVGFATAFAYWKASILEYLIYLTIYNIIFVLPLILITYGFFLTQKVDQFKRFRLKYRRIFRLIMGIVMIALAVWLILNYHLI